jgi:hypothetical protein
MNARRCADWAREVGVDPGGTAGAETGWLLVEWPLPWPRDIGGIELLGPVRDALVGTGIRLQLLVPHADVSTREVVLHRRPHDHDGWFTGFDRVARRVEPPDVVATAVGLASLGDDEIETTTAPGREILLCSHGARDRCCGSMGTALAVAALSHGIAVRRTSHTGGHRFAPTGILLPEGTTWGFLDHDALTRLVERQGSLDDLLPRYRGCSALGSAAVQAAERIAFADIGWTWLEYRRRGVDLGDGSVLIEARSPAGDELSWHVAVQPGRVLPVPECGGPRDDSPKFETEIVVRPAGNALCAGGGNHV